MGSVAKVSAPKDYAPVWPYYTFFAVSMGVLHLALAGLGTWMVVMGHEAPRTEVEPVAFGSTVAVLGVVIGVAYCYAPFAPRKPWAWRFHLALIVLGLPFCVLGALPLLAFWLRRDARRMFRA